MYKKHLMKFSIYSTLKTLRKLGIERHFISLTNGINKNLQLILLTLRKQQKCLLQLLLFKLYWWGKESNGRANRWMKISGVFINTKADDNCWWQLIRLFALLVCMYEIYHNWKKKRRYSSIKGPVFSVLSTTPYCLH